VAEGRRVLITGVAGQLAGLVSRALEERDDVLEIVGVDIREPQHDLRRTEFVRADIRNPIVGRILDASAIDTVVHMSTMASPAASGGRARMKERNVIGAMQLLAACQKAPTLRRFVLKSTTAVYGSAHTDPAMFREDATPRLPPHSGFGKDATEIEGYVRAFGRRRKDVDVTMLRFSNFLGGRVDGIFNSLFTLPVVPSVLGFDPRLQFCHEEDAVEVIVRSVTGQHPGVYNVAGDGVMYLSQCIRIAGRVPVSVPLPFVSAVAGIVRRTRRVDVASDQLRYLQFGRSVDTSALKREFDYTPHYTTQEAFRDYVRRRRIRGLVDHDEVVRWEREIHDFLQRKGQERFLAAQRREREGVR
jgi:UDP-glucose 4-epimerase